MWMRVGWPIMYAGPMICTRWQVQWTTWHAFWEDMTNAIERLDMWFKERSLTIVAGAVHGVQTWWYCWIWRVLEGMEALGTWLDKRGCSEASMWDRISKASSMFYVKKAFFCEGKFRRVLCLRRRPNEGWVDYLKRTGVIAARLLKKHSQQHVQTLAMKTCPCCCMVNGELPEWH